MRAPLFPPPNCSLVQHTVSRGIRGIFFSQRHFIAPHASRAVNLFRTPESILRITSRKSSTSEIRTDYAEKSPAPRVEEEEELENHLKLLQRVPHEEAVTDVASAPIFTYPVLKHIEKLAAGSSTPPFSQYALLAGDVRTLAHTTEQDPRIFYNVTTPTSFFICGSQGSGKSHSLSCILESCLIPSTDLGRLPNPLTGIVFHYDNYISDSNSTPCEAAYLASDSRVKVRVLCSPSNINTIKNTYSSLKNVTVEELRLDESDLNTKRMLDLMGFGDKNPPLYMHTIQTILRDMRITQQKTGKPFKYGAFVQNLRKAGLNPRQTGSLHQRLDVLKSFMLPHQVAKDELLNEVERWKTKKAIRQEKEAEAKQARQTAEAERWRKAGEERKARKKMEAEKRRKVEEAKKAKKMRRAEKAKMEQNAKMQENGENQGETKTTEEEEEKTTEEETVKETAAQAAEETAEEMVGDKAEELEQPADTKDEERHFGTDWTPKAGELIIVDLSCPCITSAMACSLFNICLSIFLAQDTALGRVVALDEAHKYMDQTADSAELTENLISAIRLQRHLGARIVISTQEPTISPKLLDLSSVAIVHRFTSPDWFNALKQHLAGVALLSKVAEKYDPDRRGGPTDGPLRLQGGSPEELASHLFARIVKLKTGEALVFAPNAVVDLEEEECPVNGVKTTHKRLSHDVMHVAVRSRITSDGGRSIMAA